MLKVFKRMQREPCSAGNKLKEEAMHETLQKGLYDLCEKRIEADGEFRAGRTVGEMNDTLFDEYRLFQLRRTLRQVNEKSLFYKRLYERKGVDVGEVSTLSDLSRLPFTAPKDLSGSSYNFLCTSQGDVEKPVTFYSSGSTGTTKRIFFSGADIQKILDFLPRGMNTVIGRDEGRVQVFLQNTHGRGIGGTLAQSLRMFGMQAWTSDLADNAEDIIRVTLDNKVNVWFGEAMTILRATRILARSMDLSKLGMRCIFITMTNIPPSMVKYLEETWACYVSTHYGLTESGWGLAVDCDVCDGYHYNELDHIIEIVDPDTGAVLPCGSEGEVVLTNIARDCMPLVRYRTGDIATLKKSVCGSHLDVLGHIQRRREGAYMLTGREIYPAIFDEPLFAVPELLDYRLHVKDDQLTIEAEVLRESADVAERIADGVMTIPAMEGAKRPNVSLLSVGALREYCYEKKRILTDG